MSLKKRIFRISMILVTLSVVIYLAVFVFQFVKLNSVSTHLSTNLEENDREKIERELASTADDVELFLNELEASIDEAMRNAALAVQKVDTYSTINTNTLKKIAEETGMDEMYLTNANGVFVMSTVDGSVGGSLYDIWDGYRMLMTGEAEELPSSIKIMAETGDIYKFTAIPRYDTNGNRTGIIESGYNAENIEASMALLLENNTLLNGIQIVQSDGIALTSNLADGAQVAYKVGEQTNNPIILEVANSNESRIEWLDSGSVLYYRPIQKFGAPAYVLVIEGKQDYFAEETAFVESNVNTIKSLFTSSVIMLIIIGILVTLTVVALYYKLIDKSVLVPISNLSESARRIAVGDVDVELDRNRHDEIGVLINSFGEVIDGIKGQTESLVLISKGDFSTKVVERSEKDIMAKSMNNMIDVQKSYINSISVAMNSLAKGDLNAKIVTNYEGDYVPIKETINMMIEEQSRLVNEISRISDVLSKGVLNQEIEMDFPGDYNLIKININKMVEAQKGYVTSISDIMNLISNGDLSGKINQEFQGDFKPIKESINETVGLLNEYIFEMNRVLHSIADNKLTDHINIEFRGDFDALKISISEIVDTLNDTIVDINNGADNVSMSADSIANGALSLAKGSSEQVETIDSIYFNVEKIIEQVSTSSQSAVEAGLSSKKALKEVEIGSERMNNLLKAMEQISFSSKEISNITETISGIAFQTNLLALNAAVEAARAGEHGKGFAVVADEVRVLASRTSASAKEIETLINESVNNVDKGETYAKETAQSLVEIVESTEKISEYIDMISKDIEAQEVSSKIIENDLVFIKDIVNEAASTTEQSASSSEELAAQAQHLKHLVHMFELKDDNK